MAQELAGTAALDLTPPPRVFLERWLISLDQAMVWEGGRPKLMQGFKISPEAEQAIRAKSLTLTRRLSSARSDAPSIAGDVARIVQGFPVQNAGSAAVGAIQARNYIEAVASFPAWAVQKARQEIFNGNTAYGRPFGPTPVELRDLVGDILAPHRRDLHRLNGLLLVAKQMAEPDPEVKEMVEDGFDSLALELGGNGPRAEREEPPTDDEIRASGAKWLTGVVRP